ncbi:MAG: glycosyltransferase family 2 protein, partial [Candidatus Sacchiramonaceae bacterium]|nr:glycosyltransferase family 2 protein [Candidatus Saccharimonadaceae bacterium]
MPKFSFIIPVYNGEKTIARLVSQILNQSYTDFELILVDDGSKDDSRQIIEGLARQDSRIVALNKPN